MYFIPHGLRNLPRAIRAHTKLDTVTRHYDLDRSPVRPPGKLFKDDQTAKGVQDYIAESFLDAHASKRKGRYVPRQIARNFFK